MKRIPATICLTVLIAAALLAPGSPARAAVDSMGMLDLLEVDTITIVYPSSPSSQKEHNRISSEKRAAHLSATKGIITRVVADSDASGDILKDNLFLLGWENRLLRDHGFTPPYGRSSATVRFLDFVKTDMELDLAFKCRSPFSTEDAPRLLFFWSRIDPGRDRYMNVPNVGSDWAFYRDFVVVAQGMLDVTQAWPPKRDLIAEKLEDLDIEAYVRDRKTIESGPLRVIFNPNRVDRSTAEEILDIRRKALNRVTAILGDPGPDFRLDLYLYLDNETKEKLTGVKVDSHSVPGTGEMHMTVRLATSSSIHEDTHPVAEAILGSTSSTAVYVGLAYALDPVLLGESLPYHAALMMDRNRMPGIADLLNEERFRKLPNAERLAAAGIFMTWLREITTLPKISSWYAALEPSVEMLAAELGTDPAKLEKRFQQWLTSRVTAHSVDVLFVNTLNEAKTYHLTGEHEKAVEALTRALSYKPEDRQTRFNLAAAKMKTGAYEDAAGDLHKIIESAADNTGGLTVHTHLQLARVYDLMGRREEALAEYRLVLEMPNRYDSHLSAREGIESPYTADRL